MQGAYGLYSHIRSNRRRSMLMIGGLFLLVYLMTFGLSLGLEALSGYGTLDMFLARAWRDMLAGMPAATIGVGLWLAFSYRFHQTLIDLVTDSHGLARGDDPRLYNLLENLCISRGITMPQLKIIESSQLNAFASGMNEKQYAVSVTRGLLEALDDRELEAVLAHELTHIRNGDVKLMVVATIMAGVISFVGEMLFRWFHYGGRIDMGSKRDGDRRDSKPNQAMAALLIAAVIIAVAWALSLVLKFGLSRSREFLADAGAVELTKDPDAMISALLKIEGRAELASVPSGIMEMCIENEKRGLADLFATHPSIEARVRALEQTAGGRRPPPSVPFLPPEGEAPAPPAAQPWGSQPRGPWG
jgi:heat shock protein HtpX